MLSSEEICVKTCKTTESKHSCSRSLLVNTSGYHCTEAITCRKPKQQNVAKLLKISEEIYITCLINKLILSMIIIKRLGSYTQKKYPDEFPSRNIKIKCHIAQLITRDNTNCIENN